MSESVPIQQVSTKSNVKDQGERYFKSDDGYDKKFYENDWANIGYIFLAFVIFYILNAIIFYGQLSFGTVFPEKYMWYNIAIFTWTLFIIAAMLISGYKGNAKKRRHEFY